MTAPGSYRRKKGLGVVEDNFSEINQVSRDHLAEKVVKVVNE
jgi:hypothetical protein